MDTRPEDTHRLQNSIPALTDTRSRQCMILEMNNILAPIDFFELYTISATQYAKYKMQQLYVQFLGVGKIKPN